MALPVHAVVIPPSSLASRTPESFSTPGRGNCTWQTLFSNPSTPTDTMCSGIAICPPHTGSLCPHRHEHAEIYHILSGKGVMTIDGKKYEVNQGTSIFVPGNAEHGIVNKGDEELKWFYVFATPSFEDVVYRFSNEGGSAKRDSKL